MYTVSVFNIGCYDWTVMTSPAPSISEIKNVGAVPLLVNMFSWQNS
jgi:hypothetical protein